MKFRVFTFIALAFFITGSFVPAAARTNEKSVKRAKTGQLVSLLPASDGVVTVDIKRMFNDAMPTILASNQPVMADVMAKIDKMQAATGIEIRKFDLMAAGFTAKPNAAGKIELDMVGIVRGDVSSAALIALAKQAAGNKYKEETVSGRQMFIFSMDAAAKKAAAADKKDWMDSIASDLTREMAIAAIDANTLAFGQVETVRQTLEAKTKVSADITDLLNRKEFAVMNMAARMPAGMKQFLPLDNDELGKSIDSVRYVWGNMDAGSGQMTMSLSARTEQITQARELYETLDVMRSFGKMALGSSKRADQQLYARLLDKVQVARSGTEISVDLTLPQTDLDQLVGLLTKKK